MVSVCGYVCMIYRVRGRERGEGMGDGQYMGA